MIEHNVIQGAMLWVRKLVCWWICNALLFSFSWLFFLTYINLIKSSCSFQEWSHFVFIIFSHFVCRLVQYTITGGQCYQVLWCCCIFLWTLGLNWISCSVVEYFSSWPKSVISAALMYVLVPMPCLFFGGGSTQFLISRDGGG